MTTNRLLYILPDLAYVADLLPTKKEFTFAIQSFRQINGEFLDETVFINKNIEKLFSKLEDKEYTALVLPDFLFTNTIVTVQETDEAKVKTYLKNTLLPSLDITTDSHFIETFILTQFKGQSKVQLAALEKSVLAPIRVAAADNDITISAVVPLSWTTKAIISLEPSLSVLQVGSKLYSAQHYIGLDQTTVAPVEEVSTIAETIKTLKGAEPSIQTIYLLSNDLVEEKLREELNAILPIQQLASFKEEESKMPSYIKYSIESGMKTLSISDFLVPRFTVTEPTDEDRAQMEQEENTTPTESTDSENLASKNESPEELPTPTAPPIITSTAPLPNIKSLDLTTDSEPEPTPQPLELDSEITDTPNVQEENTVIETDMAKKGAKEKIVTESIDTPSTVTIPKVETQSTVKELVEESSMKETTPEKPEKKETVIKNDSGVGTMLKMVFITLAVFFATVAIGVGVGLGLLKLSQGGETTDTTTVVVESPEPATSPSPSPSPIVAFEAAEYSLLVVNATTKAGYAGTIRTKLTTADFSEVSAGNAKGTYDEGNYILVEAPVAGLKEAIEKATGLTFEVVTEDKDVEDTQDAYEAVVVLAE